MTVLPLIVAITVAPTCLLRIILEFVKHEVEMPEAAEDIGKLVTLMYVVGATALVTFNGLEAEDPMTIVLEDAVVDAPATELSKQMDDEALAAADVETL